MGRQTLVDSTNRQSGGEEGDDTIAISLSLSLSIRLIPLHHFLLFFSFPRSIIFSDSLFLLIVFLNS